MNNEFDSKASDEQSLGLEEALRSLRPAAVQLDLSAVDQGGEVPVGRRGVNWAVAVGAWAIGLACGLLVAVVMPRIVDTKSGTQQIGSREDSPGMYGSRQSANHIAGNETAIASEYNSVYADASDVLAETQSSLEEPSFDWLAYLSPANPNVRTLAALRLRSDVDVAASAREVLPQSRISGHGDSTSRAVWQGEYDAGTRGDASESMRQMRERLTEELRF